MARYLIAYVVTAVVFFGLDALYLRFVGGAMYRQALGDQMADPARIVPAVAFYLIFIAGLLYFAIAPSFVLENWSAAAGRGAALGFVGYATYELTNYATLARWTPTLVFVDLTWGTLLSACASSIGYLASSRWTS